MYRPTKQRERNSRYRCEKHHAKNWDFSEYHWSFKCSSQRKKSESYFPVLVFMGYDATKNTISFSSPYLNHIVKTITIYNASLVRDKNGNLKKYRSGKQIMSPSHSYLKNLQLRKNVTRLLRIKKFWRNCCVYFQVYRNYHHC